MGFEAVTMTQGNPIPTSWSLVKVGEVADINKSTISVNNAPKWIEYIDISSVGERRIDAPIAMEFSSAPSRARRRVFPGDILISTVRPNLKHFIYLKKAKENWVASTGFAVVSAKPKVDSCYLYYYLTSENFTEYLTRVADGGAYPAFNPSEIKNSELLLPPLSEQKAIAHILSTLDDKIELNQQMNRNLEAITSAIFKSWFVDFDPVRAKMEGRQPVGMNAATAALFPDSFEDSQLGEIPKGWRVSTIGESVRVVGGSTPSTKEPIYWEGGTIYWITPKDLASLSSPVVVDTERRITEFGLQQISSGLLPKGTVLLSSRAPIGYLAIAEVPLAINQGFIAMICDRELPNHYVLQWTRANMDTIKGRANGTTFLEISKTNFRPLNIVISSSKILQCFTEQAAVLHQQIVTNIEQSRTLATIRDTLLPKLISGEIRVKEAEKLVEDAA